MFNLGNADFTLFSYQTSLIVVKQLGMQWVSIFCGEDV